MTSAPLPDHPALAQVARAIEDAGIAGDILDPEFRLLWTSSALRNLIGEEDPERLGYGRPIIEACHSEAWMGAFGLDSMRRIAAECAPYWLGSESARRALERLPDLQRAVEGIEPAPLPPVWAVNFQLSNPDGVPPTTVNALAARIHDDAGSFVGTLQTFSSGLPAQILWLLVRGDERLFERMARLVEPGKRAAALLFGDLESSSQLSKRLPTATYFQLIRALTTRFDAAVIDRSGVLGKHAGDGVTAFFLAEDVGSPSAAARAAIETARALRTAAAEAVDEVDPEHELVEPDGCRLNIGLHWGSTVYLGQVATGGRLEVSALGDEVNEAARIQESASDGQLLASKQLIEQLDPDDAAELGIDVSSVSYRPIFELDAPEKAVRDAGVVPVAAL